MRLRRRHRLWLIPVALVGLVVGGLSFRPGVDLPAHRHCIKAAGLALENYVTEHDGRYPKHPGGYGDALLLIANDEYWSTLTGPGYDPAAFREAKAAGRKLPEEQCGRVYVQGLTTRTNSEVAILFDKLSTPGGDHCHWPARLWAARGREVLFRHGVFIFVTDKEWPAFAATQIELLVQEGIPRAEAERLYAQIR